MIAAHGGGHGRSLPWGGLDLGIGGFWKKDYGGSSYFGLWTLECLFRSNVGIHRARKAIQVDGSRPRRRSWQGFPGSLLSGTLASYGAATVARTSGRGHVVEA